MRLARRMPRFGCGLLAGALLTAPIAAGAPPALPSGSAGLLHGPGAPTTASIVERLNAASMRPLATPPARDIVRPDLLWVPDRWVAVPGAPGGVLVPGHWEQRLSEREVYVPPLVISSPTGESSMIPAGVRPPADSRVSP